MLYIGLWEIDYKIVPTIFLEQAIDKLIDARDNEPDRFDEITQMIREVRQELIRRL